MIIKKGHNTIYIVNETPKFTNLLSGSFQKHKFTGLVCNKLNEPSTVIVFQMQSELHSSVTRDQLTEKYDLC